MCLCLLPTPAMWLPRGSLELHWDGRFSTALREGRTYSVVNRGWGRNQRSGVSVKYWTR